MNKAQCSKAGKTLAKKPTSAAGRALTCMYVPQIFFASHIPTKPVHLVGVAPFYTFPSPLYVSLIAACVASRVCTKRGGIGVLGWRRRLALGGWRRAAA